MKEVRIRVEIKDVKTNKKVVGWTALLSPSVKQVRDAMEVYKLLVQAKSSKEINKIKSLAKSK